MYKVELRDLYKFEDLLTDAFFNDPLFVALVKDGIKRRKITFTVFQIMLEFSPGKLELYTPTKKLEGIAIWANQREKQNSQKDFWKLVFKLIKELGVLKIIKILWVSQKLLKHHNELLQKSTYYLYIIVLLYI